MGKRWVEGSKSRENLIPYKILFLINSTYLFIEFNNIYRCFTNSK